MSDWEFVCDRLYVRSCTSLWISVGVFVWQLCIYMWVRWGVCSCVCVCVVERHSAGLHFSDKPWWVSTEWGQDEVWHPARGFLVCGGGGPRHPSQALHPSPTTPPPNFTPPPTHSPFLSGEMRAAARWVPLPRGSPPPLPLSRSNSAGLQNQIRHQIRLSALSGLSPLELNPLPIADCKSLTGRSTRGCAAAGWIYYLD